jgi:hypothetical protein
VGPRAGLEGCGKFRLPPGFDPQTVQVLTSRYTDHVIPSPCKGHNLLLITIIIIIQFTVTNVGVYEPNDLIYETN